MRWFQDGYDERFNETLAIGLWIEKKRGINVLNITKTRNRLIFIVLHIFTETYVILKIFSPNYNVPILVTTSELKRFTLQFLNCESKLRANIYHIIREDYLRDRTFGLPNLNQRAGSFDYMKLFIALFSNQRLARRDMKIWDSSDGQHKNCKSIFK